MTLTPVRAASSFLGHDLYIENGVPFCVGGFVQEDVRSLMHPAAPRLCLAVLMGLAC